jgi:chromate transporter
MSDLHQARKYRQNAEPTKQAEHPSRRHLAAYFLRLGALGFGGPVALVGHMHPDLVESRRWIREEEYRFLIVVALGWAYLRYGGLSWMQAVFYGVGASVIGLIARSAYGLARKTMGRDALLWGILLVVAVATAM